MPISRKEFENWDLDPRSFVLAFLRSNPEMAFSVIELMDEYSSRGGSASEEESRSILDELESEDRIAKGEIKGVTYYWYQRPPMGFRGR